MYSAVVLLFYILFTVATMDYEKLILAGADSIALYQETYHIESYKKHHLSGLKRHYHNRLDSVEYAAQAGFYSIALGALLGLYDWRFDSIVLAYHLHYLMKKYWKSKYAVSFPRIQSTLGNFLSTYPVSNKQLVQLISSFRLIFPDIHINLSTREPANLRDALFKLGITTISAESNTSPGGYSHDLNAEPQFEISDQRSLYEIMDVLKKNNLDPVFKDWDLVLT